MTSARCSTSAISGTSTASCARPPCAPDNCLSYADLARDVSIAPNTAKRWLSVLETSQQVFLLELYHRQRTKRVIVAELAALLSS